MVLKQHILLILLGIVFPYYLAAQNTLVDQFNTLTEYEVSDDDKTELSLQLTDILVKNITSDKHFADSLAIRQLKTISSPDGMLTLYTWHYSLSDATSQYGGIVIYGDEVTALYFNDMPIVINQKYTDDNWCGGIYYDIIPIEKKGKQYYTLLAWDGNNGVTSKKIIDVLWFDRKGKAIFGHPFFENGRQTDNRVIIEYSAANSMVLDYDMEEEAIITNSLYVNDDKFSNVSEYYSANDAFNVYRFEQGAWVLYRDVDLRMNKKDSKKLMNRNSTPSSGL